LIILVPAKFLTQISPCYNMHTVSEKTLTKTVRLLKGVPVEIWLASITHLTTTSLLAASFLLPLEFSSTESARIKLLQICVWIFLIPVSLLFGYATATYLKNDSKVWQELALARKAFSCFVYLMTFLFMAFTYITVVTVVFMLTNIEWVGKISQLYLFLDVKLSIPQLIHDLIITVDSIPWLYSFIEISYRYSIVIVFSLLIFLALFSFRTAREYGLALFMSVVISAPMWLILPAIAPLQLANTDTFSNYSKYSQLQTETEPIRYLYNDLSGTAWYEEVNSWTIFWDESYYSGLGYAVSSNPSMHIIWGILVLVYLRRINIWLTLLGVTFLLADAVGTLFFLQHYSIDLLFGALAAIITLAITKKLLGYENEHMSVDPTLWFTPILLIETFGSKLSNSKTRGLD